MTIKELIENGKGYLELNGVKLNLEHKQFKDIMRWNEGIANGYIEKGKAYNQNGTELVWEWVSLEEEFNEKDLEEGKELGLVIEEEKSELVAEETTTEVVEDILTEKKEKNKTK